MHYLPGKSILAIAFWGTLAVQQLHGQKYDVQLPIPIRFGEQLSEARAATAVTPQGVDESSWPTERSTPPRHEIWQPPTSADGEPSAKPVDPLRLPGRDFTTAPARPLAGPNLGGSVVRTLSSLAVVLGVFCLFLWFVRQHRVPPDDEQQLFQMLGRVTLLGKPAHVVKFGDKLLLLSKTASGLEKLAELSDPEEVERILRTCGTGGSRTQLARSVGQILASQERTQRST